jgi:hypothetical protein
MSAPTAGAFRPCSAASAHVARGLLLCLAAVIVACAPPETQRVRGGGAGADIRNRSPVVEMHAGSVIYPDERCAVQGAACTGPMPVPVVPPRATAPLGHDAFVLEHMGPGGALRRVIYEPPPDLAVPAGAEMEPAQPGPATGRGDVDEGGEPVDPADDAGSAERPPAPDVLERPDPTDGPRPD